MKQLLLIIAIGLAVNTSAQTHQDSILISLTNKQRTALGLKPLQYSAVLDSAVEFHNRYMVRRGISDHTEYEAQPGESQSYPGARHRVEKFQTGSTDQFSWNLRLEVCASYGQSDPQNPNFKFFPIPSEDSAIQTLFDSWMYSPAHKWVLMNPDVTHIAFAVGIKIDPSTSTWIYLGTGVVSQKIN